MTAIPSLTFHNMDTFHPDDTMDLASSPYPQHDDVDLDLDSLHEGPLGPDPDRMFDDLAEFEADPLDAMQAELSHLPQDDDMIDEERTPDNIEHKDEDLAMETYPQDQERLPENEDILFEEEDDLTEGIQTHLETQEDIKSPFHEDLDEAGFGAEELEKGLQMADQGVSIKQSAVALEDESVVAGKIVTQEVDDLLEDDTGDISSGSYPNSNKESTTHYTGDEESRQRSDDQFTNPEARPMEKILDTNIGEETNVEEIHHEAAAQDINDDLVETEQTAIATTETSKSNPQELYLHPVKVIYQDDELCLFPPTKDETLETFFLSDTAFAYDSLDKLLAACREVLAGTIGDDDELVLDIASLGLHITEDSKYASQITLSQVLEVYLMLSHNDNIEQIEPLYCNLSSRVCLVSQYAYLSASAQQGKTYTEISTEHLGSPDPSPEALGENEHGQYDQVFQEESAGEDDQDPGDDTTTMAGHEKVADDEENKSAAANWKCEETTLPEVLGLHSPIRIIPGSELQVQDHPSEAILEGEIRTNPEIESRSSNSPKPRQASAGSNKDVEDEFEVTSVHEDSQSSHTIEAEYEAVYEHFEEPAVEDDNATETTTLANNLDASTPNNSGEVDVETFLEEDDEEFLENEAFENANELSVTDEEHDFLETERGTHGEGEEDIFEDPSPTSTLLAASEIVTSTNGDSTIKAVPSTPSKNKSSKRKISDKDEEFDLLDIGTPDLKRRRSS